MIISKYNYTPLARESVEGKRHYALPDGSRVPSVTTILEKTKPAEARQALRPHDPHRALVRRERLPRSRRQRTPGRAPPALQLAAPLQGLRQVAVETGEVGNPGQVREIRVRDEFLREIRL